MTWGGKILVCVLGSLVMITGAKALAPDSPDSPYRGIVERNVFGLKPPTIAEPPAPPPPPPIKLTLTGITTILGNKRALLSAQAPNKPLESYILTEGQRSDDIEVLEINEAAGTVKVNNHGAIQTLDFQNDGAKRQNIPLPVNPLPGGIPPPINIPAPGSPNAPPQPLRTIPTRTMRLPPAPNSSVPQEASGAAPAGQAIPPPPHTPPLP